MSGRFVAVLTALAWLAMPAFGVLTCPTATSYTAASTPLASCAPYQETLPDGSLGFCAGIVNYPYYLPSGRTQAQFDQLAEFEVTGGVPSNALLLTILPLKCSFQIKKVACIAIFQPCELVDPFFADATCAPYGQHCAPCGQASSVAAPSDLVPNLTPVYGSVCLSNVDNSTVGSATLCSVGPGKVPGFGNMDWTLLKQLSGYPGTMSSFCQLKNLTWSDSAESCMLPIPRSACKSECNKLSSMDRTVGLDASNSYALINSACPLISGNWTNRLTNLRNTDPDPIVRTQANNSLLSMSGSYSTINLLVAFGLAPSCNSDNPSLSPYATFSVTYTGESLANRASSLGGLIALQASQQPGVCHCVTNKLIATPALAENTNSYCDPTKDSTYCATLAGTTAKCNSISGSRLPNSPVRFVGIDDDGMLPVCKAVVTSPNNQPSNDSLALLAGAFGLPSADVARGAFFVSPTPGLPTLAGGQMTRPLCALPNAVGNGDVYTGNDSYSCAVAAVNAASPIVPAFLQGTCRLAFLEMLCSTAHMKLELKSMCLLPNGASCAPTDVQGAQTNTIPFIFALPRFPSQFLCVNFKTQCAGFLEAVGAIGTPKRDLIEATFNCDGVIAQTCASNNPIDHWGSSVWNCNSALNGAAAYPATSQPLANINALLGTYAADNNLPALALLGVSSVANQSVSDGLLSPQSTCECPAPLVVPDDPNAPTAAPGVCCNLDCLGNMYTEDQNNELILVQKIFAPLSLIGTTFIIATWGTFKIKRSQPLTFFFGVASANVALTFIIPIFYRSDVREVWCKDNTQPNVQKDGGMCLFQSMWLTFWTICTCCFWLSQGFDLYLRIVRGERHLEHMTKYYHMFSWGYPALILAIMLGNEALGYQQNFYWCFIRQTENPAEETGLDLGMFYGSIVAIWFTGIVLMTIVLYQIWKITSKTSGTAQVSNTVAKRLAVYRTPVFFVLFFVFVWVSIFAWRFNARVLQGPLQDAATDWATCLLTNAQNGITDPATNPIANVSNLDKYGIVNGTGCGLTYPLKIGFGSYIYLMCIAMLQGVFIFIIFGAKWENFNLWKERFGLTTKKYDTTAEDSSTKDKSGNKPSVLSNAMSSLFSPASPKMANDSTEKDHGGGSAVMVNGLQSGKFIAVTEPIKSNQIAAAYMTQ